MRFLLLFLLSSVLVHSYPTAAQGEKLIFASVLWRHGQRAPSTINGIDGGDVFQRGKGQLTEAGICRSRELGRALRQRYVRDHELLSGHSEKKGEFSFHSTSVPRCKDTLQLVARGLFGEEDDWKMDEREMKITQHPEDFLIGFAWYRCAALGKIFQDKCADWKGVDITALKEYPKFEELSFKCSKAGEGATTFTTPQRGAVTEYIILLADSGAIAPEWMTPDLVQEAREVESKVLRYQLGLGEFRDEKMLKLSVGFLLVTIIKDMQRKWECRTNAADPACKVAFKGYSTHDYILNSLLELLGGEARNVALKGFLNPQMSAAIAIELWEVGGVPKVKVLYRPYALASSLRELTPAIEHCKGMTVCDLQKFKAGYASVLTKTPDEDCRIPN